MTYVIISTICFILFVIFMTFITKDMNVQSLLISGAILLVITNLIIFMDYSSQTDDTEIWSGKITSVEHTEEWEEFIPPTTETYTTTDSKGNVTTHTRVIPGYWVHHDAENHISTTDKGNFRIYEVPDGRRLTDKFVNSTEELKKFYPIGSPTASTHSYENKLKASYNSVFKTGKVNVDDYEGGLPEYPIKVNKELTIDRVIGSFKNKKEVSKHLSEANTRLNDTNNKNNKGKVKGYKQVNMMFVNFGDKPEEYGWALQDYWKNGAKNDFVVTFGTDKKSKVTWCHTFSWTDVEILKTDVREYMIGKEVKDFKKIIDDVSNMVEKKFDRKQFAEFDYIQVDATNGAKWMVLIVTIASCGIYFVLKDELI